MPFDPLDPEAVNSARLAAKMRMRQAEMVRTIDRFGENLRRREAVQAASESGREEGYRAGWNEAIRSGTIAGALAGVLLTAPIMWGAPRVLHTIAGWFA
ncbi:MAG: hypothetical protein ABI433_09970 [Burkholderiaceae bacterium]